MSGVGEGKNHLACIFGGRVRELKSTLFFCDRGRALRVGLGRGGGNTKGKDLQEFYGVLQENLLSIISGVLSQSLSPRLKLY